DQYAILWTTSSISYQDVHDIVSYNYDNAGQRFSALRFLCVQEDNLEAVRNMLKGAMQQLRVGNPVLLKTDIGPVIDAEAQQNIQKHIEQMRSKGHTVHQLMFNQDQTELTP